MRPILILACMIIVGAGACAPSAPSVPTPTLVPTLVPTSAPTAVVENPPPCNEAELIFYPPRKQMLLVNCVTNPNKETPLTIWGWNGAQWQRVTEGGPPGRILGGVAYDEKRDVLVLYGGRPVALGKCSQETWEWDGNAWTQKDASPPTACDHVRMVYDASLGESILFSGLDSSENRVNETWSWNGNEWKRLSIEGPESRGHFGFVYDAAHKQILLYGGYASTVTDEFWAWKDSQWTKIDFPGPGPLSHFGMVDDTAANAIYIFGGAGSTSTFSTLTDKTWMLADGTWRELHPENSPSKRGSPAMGYDPVRKRIVLYGGFDASRKDLADTWEWNGQTWTCLVNCP